MRGERLKVRGERLKVKGERLKAMNINKEPRRFLFEVLKMAKYSFKISVEIHIFFQCTGTTFMVTRLHYYINL